MTQADGPPAPRTTSWIQLCKGVLRLTRRHGLMTLAKINCRLFPRGQYVDLPAGARIFIPNDPHFFGFALGTHEQHISDLLVESIRPGDVCVDVGANIGYFTAIMSKLAGSSGKVLSFEPVPENFAVLQTNAILASAAGAPVIAINAAVSEQAGFARILRREYSTYHQIELANKDSETNGVSTVCLDDELIRILGQTPVKFIKIDVEGHELPVLRGLRQTLADGRVEKLVIEITPGPDLAEIRQILKRSGRSIKCWVNSGWRDEDVIHLTERTDVFVECVSR